MLGKPVIFPAPKNNGFMKKSLYNFHGLTLQDVSLVYAVCTLLLSYICSIPPVSPLQSSSLPTLGIVLALARMQQVLTRYALDCLLK